MKEGLEVPRKAIIIGAGPAGLTAAYELLDRKTGIEPIVLEESEYFGGISKTVNFKGNRIDIGGHRFFSKSDTVMDWWQKFLPLQKSDTDHSFTMKYRGSEREYEASTEGADPEKTDDVMLIRSRLSRIYFLRKFFNYPVTLDWSTIRNLGFTRIMKIGFSYIKARLFPLKEKSLEEFYVNRFGRELYNTFFKSYTEKVWGVAVKDIAPDWGAQRVKGLSISKTIAHAIKMAFTRSGGDVRQKDTETSLIEYFLYPKHGPGQLWEKVASVVSKKGGTVRKRMKVTAIRVDGGRVVGVDALDEETGKTEQIDGDYVISTMPIKDLVASLEGIAVPSNVAEVAENLPYRDFITVGILAKKLLIKNQTERKTPNGIVPDNWIYIQEPDVKVGRLQVFNNWSPYMVADPDSTVWVGMEYFVHEGDDLWKKSDEELVKFGVSELAKIAILDPKDFIDGTALRVKKTYPAYFGVYNRFDEVRDFLDPIKGLFLVGRNGMHRYNNQDHSMLTAMAAVDDIQSGSNDKSNIWNVNVEKEYHEEKSA